MNRKFVVVHLSALLTVASLLTSISLAFEEPTHEKMSLRAVQIPAANGGSSLNDYLTQVLSFEFPGGVQQPVNGKAVLDWMQIGSNHEDSPPQRVQEHFHDPTKPWNQAGPRVLGVPTGGISSVIWSQTQNQDNGVGGGNHSWQDARDTFFNALTSTNTAQRQQHWADTFQSLGNLIHLVQDAASPAHTRNDLHLSYGGFGFTDRLHVWGNKLDGLAEVGASGSLRYDPSILNLPPNDLARIPIARIIDTEQLKAGIPSEGLDIGIAEYSNANFFSDRTIFSSDYQTPTDLGIVAEPGPNGKLTEYLYRHPTSPGARYKLAALGSVAGSTTVPYEQRQWELDDFVMKSYGEKLFPRAIGYSAGLIDYFFRGIVTEDFRFQTIAGIPPNQIPSSIGLLDVSITDSFRNESVGPGTIRVVLVKSEVYASGTNVPPVTETFPDVLVSNPVSINGSPIPSTLSVSFDSLPFPTAANLDECWCGQSTDYLAFLVFKGTLGQETDNAVVVGGNCSNGYPQHLLFGHTHHGTQGHEFGILGWC